MGEFEVAARALNDMLTGHTDPAVSQEYGDTLYPLKALSKAMRSFQYDGLDVRHLYTNVGGQSEVDGSTASIASTSN